MTILEQCLYNVLNNKSHLPGGLLPKQNTTLNALLIEKTASCFKSLENNLHVKLSLINHVLDLNFSTK